LTLKPEKTIKVISKRNQDRYDTYRYTVVKVEIYPAREVIEVADLPSGASIEIAAMHQSDEQNHWPDNKKNHLTTILWTSNGKEQAENQPG
jgi:hypothetical protein